MYFDIVIPPETSFCPFDNNNPFIEKLFKIQIIDLAASTL